MSLWQPKIKYLLTNILLSMNRISSFICLLASVTIFLTGCKGKTETGNREKVIPVKTVTIINSTMTSERNYIGIVEESFSYSLSFSVPGSVEKVYVSEGQKVKKGQILATLSSGMLQSTYETTLASQKQAQDAYDRLSKLHDNGSIPEIKFVEVETGLQKANSMAALAGKNLDDCKLYAPHDGVISLRSIEPGDNMIPNVTAFKLIVINKVNIKVAIPENEIGSTNSGLNAKVSVPALGNEIFSGKVEQKGVAANPLSHTYEIKVGIENTHFALMPGMVCKVYIQQDTSGQQIVIPNRAVQISHDGKRFVWLADGNIVKRRFVKTGLLSDFGVTIEEGLSAGDNLIVEGYQKVSEGMKVSINQ